MRRVLIVIAALVAVLLVALLVATNHFAQPKLEGRLEGDPIAALAIAPPEEALTLARLGGDDRRVLLVTASGPGGLRAVDLASTFGRPFSDAVEAIVTLGDEALGSAARDAETIAIEYDDLGLPLDAAYPHIAAGANFRAHAEEVGHDEGPFLFPKLSHPTRWDADVPDRARLDHEAEICAVTLESHTASEPARLGYVLCNDFTDRWALLREIDPGGPMGPTGFPDAKGGEGMLPIGPLLVVPRDAETFHRELSLELYVNGVLRQRAVGGQMIWSPSEIVGRALADCDVAYTSEQGPLGLTDCAGIPARTLILTGTPSGVMFHFVTIWSKQAYLGPGDEVVTTATWLGALRNRVR